MGILIVGDLMIDHWIVGGAQAKICQEAPIPIYDEVEDIYLPGGAGNLAMNVRNMGADYQLLCPIGEMIHDYDDEGYHVSNPKNNYHIKNNDIVAGGNILHSNDIVYSNTIVYDTTYKNRLVCDDYLIARWDRNYILTDNEAMEYHNLVLDNMDEYTTMIVTDYNKGAVNNELFLQRIVRDFKGNIVLDPYSCRDIEWYKRVLTYAKGNVILVPNDKEMDADMIDKLLGWCKCSIVMKCGADGCILYDNSGAYRYKSAATTVRSVVGAGDAVTGTIGVCIDKGIDLETGCHEAMICAADAIQNPLTVVTSRKIE